MGKQQHDWGVPNWRDASAYPKPDDLTPTLWKWEFLRRDEGYRKDWQVYQFKGASHDAPKIYEALPKDREKYRLTSLPNPADPSPRNIYFWPTDVRVFFGGEDLCEINLPETHVVVVFDLDSSIPEQVTRAKVALLGLQRQRQGFAKRHRGPSKSKWPTLLRILDAKAAGATYEEIGRKVLNLKDYSTASSNAQEYYKVALEMWKRINPSSM